MTSDELDPKKNYDPVFLFMRSDERLAMVESDQKKVEFEWKDHQNFVAEKFREQNALIEKLIERMNNQVSKTGEKNTDSIVVIDKKLTGFETQLFDPDTGVITQFKVSRDWQSNFNRTVIAVFLIGGIGAAIKWLITVF